MSSDAVLHRDLTREYPRIVRAEGSYLYAKDGTQYLDGSSGAVAANLGHGVKAIADAMYRQAQAVGFAHTLRFETDALHEAATRISNLASARFSRVFFANSGAEANEAAMKLARQYHLYHDQPGRHLIIGFRGSYHGSTLGSLAVGGDTARRQPYTPMLPRTLHLPGWRDSDDPMAPVDALRQLVRREGAAHIAALILEPVSGSQLGAYEPPHEALRRIASICTQHGITLIADEVMTGFGRCGTNFASERSGIAPDIITFGKGVTAGYAPLSGMLMTEALVAAVRGSGGVFHHGSTYSGHPISVAAAAAALRVYVEHRVLENVHRQGQRISAELRSIASKAPELISELRGEGLLFGVEFHSRLAAHGGSQLVHRLAMRHGLVLYPGASTRPDAAGTHRTFPHVLVAPPLTISDHETTDLITRLDATITTLKKEHYAHDS